ncbi:MAG: SRPBCC family protein [Planctomycetota bacterium]|jgi:uncharacterized protein YndB with AHSA1/START domain
MPLAVTSAVDIRADQESIWPFVSDPILMSEWNAKIVAVKRPEGSELVSAGERFGMIFLMSGRERRTEVQVVECVKPQLVTYRHRLVDGGDPPRFVTESYALQARGDGATRVTKKIDLSEAGIPRLMRPLLWFITRFGRRVEQPYLEKLRAAVES